MRELTQLAQSVLHGQTHSRSDGAATATARSLIQWDCFPVLPIREKFAFHFVDVRKSSFMHFVWENASHVSLVFRVDLETYVLLQLDHNLSDNLRDKEVSCTDFRQQLKTFMFHTGCSASWHFLIIAPYTFTYLLTHTVVNWVQVGWICRPQIRLDKIRRLLTQQFQDVNGILHNDVTCIITRASVTGSAAN